MKKIYIVYFIIMIFIITGCVMVLKDQAKITVEKQVHGITVDNRINIDTLTTD